MNTSRAATRGAVPPSMIGRMTTILDGFPTRSTRLTLEEVAHRTGLPRSTTHRITAELVRLGWLTQTQRGYLLGPRALRLGGGDVDGPLREAAAPVLHELQTRTDLVVHLAVLDAADIRYLDKIGGSAAAAVPSRVGGRAPAHSTALGKALLAWLPPEEVHGRVGEVLARQTDRTIFRLPALHQELARIRRRGGLAFERGECVPTVSCVAAAIRTSAVPGGGPLAGISLCGEVAMRLERCAPLVLDAVRRVSLAMERADADQAWAELSDDSPADHVAR